MQLEDGDLILFKSKKKKIYGFVSAILPNAITVTNAEDPNVVHSLENTDCILANFTNCPDYDFIKAKIYKKDYIKPFFGKVTEFRDVVIQDRKQIEEALDSVATSDACNLPLYPISVEVLPSRGSNVGGCKTNDKKQETVITLSPKEFERDNIKEILYHQLGIALWSQKVPTKMKEKWIKFYDRNMTRSKVQETELEQLRQDFIAAGMTVSDFIKSMSEKESEMMKRVVKAIKQDRNLEPKHIDILLQSGNDLKAVWPEYSVNLVEYNALLSKESMKSVESFFAEAYMFRMMNLPMEQSVINAVDKTLTNL